MPARSPRPARTRATAAEAPGLREHILATASRLFYERGVRAVGVDLVVDEAGIAKTSLYRHFPTKDDLIVAFLVREDDEFWAQWDGVAAGHEGEPEAELDAHMHWIGERLSRGNYRGCPQINVAAEFSEPDHPSRAVHAAHMRGLVARLATLARALGAKDADALAVQLAVLVNGAFVSSGVVPAAAAPALLASAARALVVASRSAATLTATPRGRGTPRR